MKRLIQLLIACSSMLMLGGCWDREEVNDLAIITAAAIDAKENNQIELSVQVFVPQSISSGGSGGGGGGQSGGAAHTIVRFQTGSNLSDALSKLQSKVPRKIFFGQCKVYIFGEELARRGIQEHMDFLLRYPEPRERASMYISEGNAKKLLELQPPLERYSAEVARELSSMHIGMEVPLQDLDEMLIGSGKAAALPYLGLLPPDKGEKKIQGIPYILGSAVLKEDKMVGTLSGKSTRGLLWIRDEIDNYTVTLKLEGEEGEISVQALTNHVRLIPHISDDKWSVRIKARTEAMVIQNGTNLELSNPDSLRAAEEALESEIKKRIEVVLQQVQHEMKADILNFGRAFYRKYPRQWKENEHRWSDLYPELNVEIAVEANINRQGFIDKPGGLPEEAVKKK